MVGIAFGVDPRGQTLGTVLVAERLQHYDLQRISTNARTGKPEILLRGERIAPTVRLVDRLRQVAAKWSHAPINFGLILSGQKLIDNVDYRNALRATVPDAIGGEMEGAGFSVPARTIEWGLVKAIADWADGHKRQRKALRQSRAATAAARFVLAGIKSGALASIESAQSLRISNKQGLSRISLPDLLTPGVSSDEFIREYEAVVGRKEARDLLRIRDRAIRAVAGGRFKAQVALGEEIQAFRPDDPYLVGIGHYFAGEGLRLLADLAEEAADKEMLLGRAVTAYGAAEALLPHDPRPLRGLGRINEIQLNLRLAQQQFEQAEGLSIVALNTASPGQHSAMAHERLRTARHLLHSLIDLRRASTTSVWHKERKKRELEGLVAKCENLHHELLPYFSGSPAWQSIEAFMGYVFIAEAWGALGCAGPFRRALLRAIGYRAATMRRGAAPSEVERMNLFWIASVANDGRQLLTAALRKEFVALQTSLLTHSDASVRGTLKRLVSANMALRDEEVKTRWGDK